MIEFCFGKENDSSRRVILKIELELKTENKKRALRHERSSSVLATDRDLRQAF